MPSLSMCDVYAITGCDHFILTIIIVTYLLALKHNRRLFTLPPYLSFACILVGVVWLLLLPLDQYSRNTYVSENALLPGQVHTYFGGSEHNIFRAYRQEVSYLEDKTSAERAQGLRDIFKLEGLKTASQQYSYTFNGGNISGVNAYAILQGPRADATEAVVLIAAWKTYDGKINYSGVALVLTLARYFKRWSLWSKDIIFVIPEDSIAGPQAWADAYHDVHNPEWVQPLTIKSGALQGAVAVEYPAGTWGHRFDKLHVRYDGTNGQLPNLDLINTAVGVASGQMGIGCTIQRMWNHEDKYLDRLQTMLRGMVNQALGHPTGPHSAFIPYHVDAITLQTVGDGWQDEMSLGRTIEGMFRSLNNLLEHLHQSFFFFLLMNVNRFVSIGTYLPSAMLIAGAFTLMSIFQWVDTGGNVRQRNSQSDKKSESTTKEKTNPLRETEISQQSSTSTPRPLILPAITIGAIYFFSLLPLSLFNHTSSLPTFLLFGRAPPARPADTRANTARAVDPAELRAAAAGHVSERAGDAELLAVAADRRGVGAAGVRGGRAAVRARLRPAPRAPRRPARLGLRRAVAGAESRRCVGCCGALLCAGWHCGGAGPGELRVVGLWLVDAGGGLAGMVPGLVDWPVRVEYQLMGEYYREW